MLIYLPQRVQNLVWVNDIWGSDIENGYWYILIYMYNSLLCSYSNITINNQTTLPSGDSHSNEEITLTPDSPRTSCSSELCNHILYIIYCIIELTESGWSSTGEFMGEFWCYSKLIWIYTWLYHEYSEIGICSWTHIRIHILIHIYILPILPIHH